ncbi:MAG: HAMP domain-containing sensor histidine kinase [Sulfurimonadaceae bacterium]|jgi:signal transduction histidine kinase|nr:HAMP domain-containing sensor histidine kinase [Sulfurimonadaceae bacterium]
MIFLLFIFTIIFAYLLIKENYQDYEKALIKEQIAFEEQSYFDYEEEHISNQKKLKKLLIKNTMAITTLAFIIFAIMFGMSKVFHALLRRDIDNYLQFFKKASHSHATLDDEKFLFHEFKMMVPYANTMTSTISDQKRVLTELNQGLEQQIFRKTEKLLNINSNLLKEQKLRDELIKAQKEFLRYTVHETNTPLSVILTNIELYNMQHEKNKHLSKIEVAVKMIFSIYDDLSYLVKKNQVAYPKAAIDLEAFVSFRLDFFEEVAEMSHLKFYFSSSAKELYIYFNETKLQRIVDNTITNAIKYTPANEAIDIILTEHATSLELSVGSKSKQIEDRDKIFEAFYREERSADGFGLGLGLVQSICQEEGVTMELLTLEDKNIFSFRFKMMGK